MNLEGGAYLHLAVKIAQYVYGPCQREESSQHLGYSLGAKRTRLMTVLGDVFG